MKHLNSSYSFFFFFSFDKYKKKFIKKKKIKYTRGVLRENYKQFSTYDFQPNLKEKNKKKDEKQHSNLLVYPHIILDRKPIQFWVS